MHQNKFIQKNRRIQMKRAIEQEFDHLAPDEVDILAAEYEKSETRMIEVIEIRKNGALVADLFEDLTFSNVIFPDSIIKLLDRDDTFLATFGLKNKKWTIIYLSPPYDEFKFTT